MKQKSHRRLSGSSLGGGIKLRAPRNKMCGGPLHRTVKMDLRFSLAVEKFAGTPFFCLGGTPPEAVA
jgi:hypothetical protein